MALMDGEDIYLCRGSLILHFQNIRLQFLLMDAFGIFVHVAQKCQKETQDTGLKKNCAIKHGTAEFQGNYE
jgi:hypothetical protein